MALPKIIAGPILRRVDKSSVSVWLACTENAHLTLKLYDSADVKLSTGSSANASDVPGGVIEITTTSAEATTIQFGKRIWVAVVTAKTQLPLQPSRVYSYNVQFTLPDTPSFKGDLRTEGLLSSKYLEVKHEPLGYKKDVLPNFLLPADVPENLYIAQASCRKMHGHGQDALASLDSIIKDNRAEHKSRPQQLFLTGDQIYADDVPGPLLRFSGTHSGLSLTMDEKMNIEDDTGTTQEVDADITNFPPYLRQNLIIEAANMSSAAAANHIISFGEYCALYLNYWSLRSWHHDLLALLKTIQDNNSDSVLSNAANALLDSAATSADPNLKTIYLDAANLRSSLFKLHFDKDDDAKYQLNPVTIDAPAEQTQRRDRWIEKIRRTLKAELKEMAVFAKALPSVSRVLANVPCYMIFDDHEITDDWYLSKRWNNQVLSRPFGRDIIRNGLMAYAVFQDWGNVPDDYVAIAQADENASDLSPRTKLLRKTSDYAFTLAGNFSTATLKRDTLEPIESLLGMGAEESQLKWHYSVNTGPTKSFVLDTRTRREYPSLNSPPGLLTEDALSEQLPDTLPGGAAPFTFVISPAPVLGIGGMEELVQPATASVFGMLHRDGKNPGFLGGMLDTDYEAWGFNSAAFEALIQRMSKLKKVIILSGDVHYGFSAALDFWKENATAPEARIIQFTSSALKNESYGPIHLFRSAIIQKLLSGIGDKLEKLGWNNRVLTVSGNVSIKNRHRLRQNPAVIPVAGWSPGAQVSRTPDYRWRLKMISDESVRPTEMVIPEMNPSNPGSMSGGYEKVVQRHQASFISGVHRRMVWPANIGLLKFDKDAGTGALTVKHDFLFSQRKRDGSIEKAKTHIKHKALLVAPASDANRPELP